MAISQICRKMNFCDGICLSRTFWFYTPQAFIWLPGNSFKALEIKIIREKTWSHPALTQLDRTVLDLPTPKE